MSNIFCIGNDCFNMEFVKHISCDDEKCTMVVRNTNSTGDDDCYTYRPTNPNDKYKQVKKYFNLLKKKSS